MPFLTVGGVTPSVSAFERLPNEMAGGPVRTLSGQLRGDPLWSARGWRADVVVESDVDASNLYSIADDGASNVVCSGDALGGSVTCRVQITGDGYEAVDGGWYRVISLTLREAL